MFIYRSALFSLLMISWFFTFAQTPLSPSQLATIDSLVRRDVPENAPGVACGIVQNGVVLHTRYAGFGDLDNRQLIGPDTRFNIASNGKQFTALAVLTLLEEGKLSLDDDIRTFFPELLPMVEEPVTIRHLLTHRSGIRDVYDLMGLQGLTWWEQTMNNEDIVAMLQRQTDLNFPPGTSYLYSNSNYLLLAGVVARVSGKSFSAFTEELFRRLGMPNTRFEADHQNIPGPVARPYFNFDTWTTYAWIWNAVGDGNLFTTLPDQLRFEQILQTRQADGFSREVIALSQQRISGGGDYGYGVEFSTHRGQPVVFHHGGTGAWKATFLRFPEKNLAVLTFSNSGKTDVVDQNQAIADVLLGVDPQQSVDYPIAPGEPGPFVAESELEGVYRDEGGSTFRFFLKEGQLVLARAGRNDVQLERAAGNVFRQVYDPAFQQEFRQNEAGNRTVTAYYPSHPPYTLTRVDADFRGFDPASLNGSYLNEETEISLIVEFTAEREYRVSRGDQKSTGLLISPHTMLVDFYTLTFSGQELLLDGGRIRRVKFVKER